jgi:hypothetical protein
MYATQFILEKIYFNKNISIELKSTDAIHGIPSKSELKILKARIHRIADHLEKQGN